MKRLLACTSVIALCAGFTMSSASANDAKPSAVGASAPASLDGQIQRAKELREQGSFADASKALRQLMLVAASDPRVESEYGKVLIQQGYAKDAVSVLTKAIQLSGNDWTLYSALGVAYDQLDNHAQARQSYDRALAVKPGEPSVLNNYAVSRMLAGDYDGAVQMLSQLHSDDPKIAANLAKAEELKASHAPKAVTAQAQPVKQAPAIVATASKSDPTVVMQKVPIDLKAGPVRSANSAPRTLVVQAPARPILAAEASKLRVSPNSIVMQKVPVDPQAGPVKTASTKAQGKLAETAKPATKPQAKSPAPPTLRTASD
ncbi:MAG TPA: tetratricopeptide repeat protein [Rhizomicrobium sp.]|jgi:Flp pilus assembly protein TadD